MDSNSTAPSTMTTSTAASTPHSQWRNCQCPLNEKQDGVCGCPKFWERKVSQTQAQSNIERQIKQNSTRLRSPSTTPPDPPREICFFWYHGTCRRGEQCKLAHESYITWPMTAPPGFVHFESCELPLCPLRNDLVAFKQDPNPAASKKNQQQRRSRKQLSGQLDGAVFSSLSHSTSVDGGHSHESTTLIDPNSRPLNGAYSDLSEFESDDGGEVNAQLHELVNTTKPILTPLPLATTDNIEHVDLSKFGPPSPSSDCDQEPLLSLSHSGSLGKRKRATSPNVHGSPSKSKRSKRELKPLNANNEDLKEHLEGPHTLINKFSESESSAKPFSPHSNTPKGPRGHGNKLICFYWYHKGHCTPRRKNGRVMECRYSHSLDIPIVEVSMPPNIGDHLGYSLPLCPIRLFEGIDDHPKQGMRKVMESPNEHGPATPTRSHHVSSSSPRNNIAEARHVPKGPKSHGSPNYIKVPMRNGLERVRAKNRMQDQKCQDAIKIQTLNLDMQLQEKKETRKMKRQEKKGKRLQKQRREANGTMLNYDDDTEEKDTTTPATSTKPCPKKSKRVAVGPCESAWELEKSVPISKDPHVLVDYGLPMGDDRLEWDTDRVRRLSGEIE
jgi:hypothetical protein